MIDYYLLRHAHVDYSPEAGITGENPLTPIGHRMAERLAARCMGWKLDYLIVSPMRRAQETAAAISARVPDLPRREMAALEEVNIRDLEGFPSSLPDKDMRSWEPEHFGHAYSRMWERAVGAWAEIQELAATQELERVAIVSHAGVINALLRHFMGDERNALSRSWFEIDWASTTCVRQGEDGRWIRWINDARHIDDLRPALESLEAGE